MVSIQYMELCLLEQIRRVSDLREKLKNEIENMVAIDIMIAERKKFIANETDND